MKIKHASEKIYFLVRLAVITITAVCVFGIPVLANPFFSGGIVPLSAELLIKEESREQQEETEEKSLTIHDLAYWFQGIDVESYEKRIRDAVYQVPTTGVGFCASWVSYVYQSAGLGFVGGNACDMWKFLCMSDNTDDMREGMIIAVHYSPTSLLGQLYGHCGIVVKNPDYQGSDLRLEIAAKEKQIKEIDDQIQDQENIIDADGLIQEKISLQEELDRLLQEDSDQYFYVNGHLIQADQNGNEKWLVADSTTRVSLSSLSSWINQYDSYRTIAWGWGHNYSGRIAVWEGDLPASVLFVYHEAEATEEELEAQAIEDPEENETTTSEQIVVLEQEMEESVIEEVAEFIFELPVEETETTQAVPVYVEPETMQTEPIYEEPETTQPEPVYEEPEITQPEPVYEEPETTQPEPVYEEPVYEDMVYEEYEEVFYEEEIFY